MKKSREVVDSYDRVVKAAKSQVKTAMMIRDGLKTKAGKELWADARVQRAFKDISHVVDDLSALIQAFGHLLVDLNKKHTEVSAASAAR
jgi:hypothetical protein